MSDPQNDTTSQQQPIISTTTNRSLSFSITDRALGKALMHAALEKKQSVQEFVDEAINGDESDFYNLVHAAVVECLWDAIAATRPKPKPTQWEKAMADTSTPFVRRLQA